MKILILGPTTLTAESGAFTISSTIGTVGYPNNKICKLLENYVRISIYVIVMGIIKCGVKYFYFDLKQTRKNKNHSKTFFARMIPISITYIVLFICTQII